MADLTQKQKQVLNLRAEGYLNKQISALLMISEVTIHQHLSACCKKLNATNTAHAIAIAANAGILNLPAHPVSVSDSSGESVDLNKHKNLELTTKDRQILQFVAKGDTNIKIADELGVSIKTIESYFQRMALRNGTKGRMSLAMSAVRSGQITL